MAKSRIRLVGAVSVSASSCRRGEPIAPVSANPGGVSRATRTSPTVTANGAAAHWKETAASRAAKMRIVPIVRIIRIFRRETALATILDKLPRGEKIGIAFSGGLDTSAAVH